MVNVPWPAPFNTNIDPEEACTTFKAAWNNYCRATEMNKWSAEQESRKISIREDAIKKYNNFGITENMKSCEDILEVMSTKMLPKKNVIYNRYIFHSRNQGEESFDVFYIKISKLIENCNYKDLRDELLRDKIVFGIRDLSLKKELLKRENLTLIDAVNMWKASQLTELQIKSFTTCDTESIKKIADKTLPRLCKFCGTEHEFKKNLCPAWGKKYKNCKGKNHSDKVCKKTLKKKVKEVKNSQPPIELSNSSSDPEDSDAVVKKIGTEKTYTQMAESMVQYKCGKTRKTSKCLLDTAADECLVGLKNIKDMMGKESVKKLMRPSKKILFGFGGNNIIIHGQIDIVLKVQVAGKQSKYKITFQVVHTPHIPLLSCKACTKMGLVK